MIIDRDLVVLFPIILTSLAVISRTSSFLKNEMARSSVEASSVSWCCSWDWCTAILPGGFRESGKSSEFGQWSACKQKQSIKIKTDFAFLRSHVVYFSPMTFGFVLVCLFVLVLLIVFCRLSSFFLCVKCDCPYCMLELYDIFQPRIWIQRNYKIANTFGWRSTRIDKPDWVSHKKKLKVQVNRKTFCRT